MIKKGWTVAGNIAEFRGGTLEGIYSSGKLIDKQWTYRAIVVYQDGGLTIDVEDDKDERGMAHGGSYTCIDIPSSILINWFTKG